MASKLGLHWLRVHPDSGDFDHIARMQYRSVKTFEWMHGDRNFCNDLLAALPSDAYILARNHPRSEQKQDVWNDPVGTGRRHADEWERDLREGRCFLPTDRTFFLGVNEPDATNGDRGAIGRYTVAFLDRLREHGLRGGAFNFSTGHPRTVDGTPNTLADYTVFEASRQAIVRGQHIGVLHIYGTGAVPLAPGHYDRLRACAWQDVQWVVGEFGIDEHVIGGGPHVGFHGPYQGRLDDYCAWLDTAIQGIGDPRIHSYQVFTYDFSKPWDSFNVRPIRAALESYPWTHANASAGHTVYAPVIGTPQPPQAPSGPTVPQPPSAPVVGVPVPPQGSAVRALVWPAKGVITQRFGENVAEYRDAFGSQGHNGLDIANATGTPVVAVAAGEVAWVGADRDYGNYLRIWHPALGLHSFYAHLDKTQVQAGQSVAAGQPIATMGNTGNSTGPHLHFEIRLGTRDGYGEAAWGHSKGRVDPQTVFAVLGTV